jgi:mono/diheme cytochrome c family protein
MLTAHLFNLPDATELITAAKSANTARGVRLVAANLLTPSTTVIGAGGRSGGPALTSEEQQLVQQGQQVFQAVCFACHAPDGRGQALAGSTTGALMAPPLAGSPRVQAHRDYVIKVLLKGLTGPIEGKTYSEVMIPMGENSDTWIAGVASYIRTSFGNAGDPVTPADVARVRAEVASRKTSWTVPELVSTLPRLVDAQTLKLSASQNAEQASAATSVRGWTSVQPQAAGMWVQMELPAPTTVVELQFDSTGVTGLGGGSGTPSGGRAQAAAGRGRAAGPPAAPAVTEYPRGYSVTTSIDGTTWSKPIAQGKGSPSHMVIVLPPTRATFVRITPTDTTPNAPTWAVANLRLYDVPAAGK